MSSPCAVWKISVTAAVGVVVIIIGIVSFPFLNNYAHQQIAEQVVLRLPPDNETEPELAFKFWKDVPQPMKIKFYLFHVVNPDEILEKGEKPYLEERGPYVYSEHRHKKDIKFSENGSLVSFREHRLFHFIPEESHGGEDDIVRLLNMPFLTVLTKAQYKSLIVRIFLKQIIKNASATIFVNKTVKEWIWGYDDRLLELVQSVDPTDVPLTYFGWFMNKNDTADGNLTIYTGAGNLQDEATIHSWDGEEQLNVWTDKYCNAINGTDGTFFHPFVQKEDTLYMFTNDICRSLYGRFQEEATVNGIKAYKFIIPKEVFENETINPDNACFCTPDDSHCLGTGLLNISNCQFGAPVVSSQPHLFQANPAYRDRLFGLHPSADLHQTKVHIEPNTGMVLDAAKRLQMNGFVSKMDIWKEYLQEFPHDIVFPVIWIEESAVLDDHTASQLRAAVISPLNLVFAAQVTLTVVGGFILGCALLLAVHRMVRLSRDHSSDTDALVRVDESADPGLHAGAPTPRRDVRAFENPLAADDAATANSGRSVNRQVSSGKSDAPDWLAKIS